MVICRWSKPLSAQVLALKIHKKIRRASGKETTSWSEHCIISDHRMMVSDFIDLKLSGHHEQRTLTRNRYFPNPTRKALVPDKCGLQTNSTWYLEALWAQAIGSSWSAWLEAGWQGRGRNTRGLEPWDTRSDEMSKVVTDSDLLSACFTAKISGCFYTHPLNTPSQGCASKYWYLNSTDEKTGPGKESKSAKDIKLNTSRVSL